MEQTNKHLDWWAVNETFLNRASPRLQVRC